MVLISKPISLQPHLSGMKEIPRQSFLRETRAYKMVNVDNIQNGSNWTLVAVSLVASIFFVLNVII